MEKSFNLTKKLSTPCNLLTLNKLTRTDKGQKQLLTTGLRHAGFLFLK